MKLLLISVKSERSRGGIATWTRHFLANCEKQSIFCDLVNTDLVGRRALHENAPRSFWAELVRTCRIFRNLKHNLMACRYDAAHLNTSCGTFGLFRDYFIAKCIKKKGIRLVTHFHCDIPYWVNRPISCRCLRRLLAISDENLVLCESSRLYLETKFGAMSRKMPNFLDDAMVRQEAKVIADTVAVATFVGRVSEMKGAQELYMLAKRLPFIEFRLVGDVSDSVNVWERPKNITLVGGLPHSKVLSEMDKADIFIFPSHSEGFSLALTEAMARGLPSIATDVGATADMLAGGCGTVVNKGDVDAMVAAIECLADPAEREEMSRRAVEKVQKQYTTAIILEELKGCYLAL